MKTKNIDKYKEIMQAADEFNASLERYHRTIRERLNCDKYDFGFNLDSRFSTMKVSISLDSWIGYSGDKNCHTVLSTNQEIFSQAFVTYCNRNKMTILKEMEKIVRSSATKYKIKAEQELLQLQEMLTSQEEEK